MAARQVTRQNQNQQQGPLLSITGFRRCAWHEFRPGVPASAAHPAAQTTGLTPPTFNLFSTPSHSMNPLPKTGFTPLASALGAPSVAVGGLGPGADPAALVAAVNAARASVEAAASRPAMVPAFPGSTPAAEFRDNIRLALEGHLPRLEALARAVIEGMYVHPLRLSPPKPPGIAHSRSYLPKALTELTRPERKPITHK
jgi:hypothetical protein